MIACDHRFDHVRARCLRRLPKVSVPPPRPWTRLACRRRRRSRDRSDSQARWRPRRQRRDQRPGDVVLGDLGAGLAADALELAAHLLLGLLARADRVEVEVVDGDPPLEQRHQQDVVERLEEVDRMPGLVRVDPHDLVAEVLVLAADVGVGVVDVVVRVLPRLRGRGGVPVPGGGVDLGIVHPVPLAVHDVVADLHVLEDLGGRVGRRPRPTQRRYWAPSRSTRLITARRRCRSIIAVM